MRKNGHPLDSSSSRSNVMTVAVGFNPRTGSRDIAPRRVATVENKPRAIDKPGHFNRRYATNGWGGPYVPWVKTHGYCRIVATRRELTSCCWYKGATRNR